MFDDLKKTWTMMGTFGLVKPLGLLALGMAGGGGAAALGLRDWIIALVLLVVSSVAGIVVLICNLRRNPSVYFNPDYYPQKPAPAPVPEPVPEPWKWTAEVVPSAPSAIDPPRVFIAGQVITSERVEHA